MYLFNGICLTDNLVKNLHRQVTSEFAGISQEFFLKYFENKDSSYAIKFKNIFQSRSYIAN